MLHTKVKSSIMTNHYSAGGIMQCLSARPQNNLKLKIVLVIVFYQYFFIPLYLVIGSLVNGSDFQDLIYLSKVCNSGSLEGVVAGSHYNRCWYIHSTISEAL